MTNQLKIYFLGSGQIAVPVLKAVAAAPSCGWSASALSSTAPRAQSQTDADSGRGGRGGARALRRQDSQRQRSGVPRRVAGEGAGHGAGDFVRADSPS
ncbi:MAG: hypothetical protein L6W00_13965 [Lentisphaeria bacterium]|nr:MAG: hypothetical protein L6W00_13965 [Lentisphaeria bacterium]